MKINKKICFTIFILISVIITVMAVIPSHSLATDPIANPDDYKPGAIDNKDIEIVGNKAGTIFNVITTAGIVVMVITLMIIGIKYMLGSVQEKAEYKKTMIPYIVGALFVLGISTVLRTLSSIIFDVTSKI